MTDCSSIIKCIKNGYVAHCASTTWGLVILIMRRDGKAFARFYQYSDDKATVYLDWLSVNVESQRQGIGTELQEMREEIGRKLGATTSCLWVRKDAWMRDWYKKRGYEDWMDNENEENAIWMTKALS